MYIVHVHGLLYAFLYCTIWYVWLKRGACSGLQARTVIHMFLSVTEQTYLSHAHSSSINFLLQVQKEYKKIVRRARWLPECLRVKYGGARGSSGGMTPNQSTSSGNVSTYMSVGRSSTALQLTSQSLCVNVKSHYNTPSIYELGCNIINGLYCGGSNMTLTLIWIGDFFCFVKSSEA